jgi:meso-butanediol dehydrogenase / (S,S)-butanediol dehydrogenase / diacetyl reductase
MNQPQRFSGRSALVIGASSGIGKAIAERLVAEGARVCAAARRVDLLQGLEQRLGASLHGIRCDVLEEADVASAVDQAVQHFDGLDLLFNVAGGARFGTIADGATADWDAVMQLTLRSAYLGTKYAARWMIANGREGAIVNISSLNQLVPFYGAASYATAKAGLGMLTQNAALELARHRIRVNALLPGLTSTPATGVIGATADINQAYMERIPMGRAADAAEIAAAAVFLASADASYITGASLLADGGWATTGYPDSSKWLGRWTGQH